MAGVCLMSSHQPAAAQLPGVTGAQLCARDTFHQGLRGAKHTHGHHRGDDGSRPRSRFNNDLLGDGI